jgi:FkbM family methyltransferase
MSRELSIGGLRAIEGLIGRRRLWRLGRLVYSYARREVGSDPQKNGEYALHRKLAKFAYRQSKPLTVIDIGGFTGYWSSHLLETCRAAGVEKVQLWAFEPSQESRAQLVQRLKCASPQYRVTVRPEAVSDACGIAAFESNSAMLGAQRLLTDETRSGNETPEIQVPVTTLAAFFSSEAIEAADYVKTDVEGFDLRVIHGALPLLAEGRVGLLQFEYNHCWVATRSYLSDVFDIAAGLPYRVCKIVPDGIESFAAWHPELETFFDANFVLVRDDLIEPLGVREGRFDTYNTYATA